MAGEDWSREEVEATVGDYFAMLRGELAGLRVNKARHNERLRSLLQGRSKGSVEFKHANISAVLTLHGYPYIDGYKPRFNFQALLEQVVLEYLDAHRDFFEPLVTGPVLHPMGTPDPDALDTNRLVEPPPDAMQIPQTNMVSDQSAQSIRLCRARCCQPRLGATRRGVRARIRAQAPA